MNEQLDLITELLEEISAKLSLYSTRKKDR